MYLTELSAYSEFGKKENNSNILHISILILSKCGHPRSSIEIGIKIVDNSRKEEVICDFYGTTARHSEYYFTIVFFV